MDPDIGAELNFLIARVSSLILIYAFCLALFPAWSLLLNSIFIIGLMSTFYKSSIFNSYIMKNFFFRHPDLVSKDRASLVDAVVSFQKYKERSMNWNNRRKAQFKRLSFKDQKQAKQLGYLDKVDVVAKTIDENAVVLNEIANHAISKYDISAIELKSASYRDNSRVIESLCHFARDWSQLGDKEYAPIFNFINQSLDKFVPNESDRKNTLVIVPGSGLGKCAHYLSTLAPAFKQVESIEFSHLMYLCNEFIYSGSGKRKSFKVHPFLHNYSHHLNLENQISAYNVDTHSQPPNLKLNYGDFRKFKIDNIDQYDKIIVVSCFFIDTAENLFEYFQAIEDLIGDKPGLWINAGPLKYGTQPKVEFNLNELEHLRKLRGWKDLLKDDSTKDGHIIETVGYLTDENSLWRGYYGLAKWASTRNV